MFRHEVLLYGAGPHARLVADCLRGNGLRAVGAVVHGDEVSCLRNVPLHATCPRDLHPDAGVIICLPANHVRRRLSSWLGRPFAGGICHPDATLHVRSVVEYGSVVCAGAVVASDCYVGKHVVIGRAAVVSSHSTLDDFAYVSPGAVLCAGVTIGEGSFIGPAAVVAPGVTVGPWTRICGGAVVTRHVAPGKQVRGAQDVSYLRGALPFR